VFPLTNNINNVNGLIEFAATTLGATPPGPNGNGTLLTIEWTSTSTLSTQTTTDLILQNVQITEPNGTIIPSSLLNANVTISPCYIYDFDCDCDVDIVDITMVAYYYGWTCSTKALLNKLGNVSNSEVFLGFESSQILLKPDGTFDIELGIDNINQLGGFEVELGFDPESINVMNVEIGDFIESTNRSVYPVEKSIDNDNGKVNYSITTLGFNRVGASGSGTLLIINCRPLKSNFEMPKLNNAQLVQIDGGTIDYKLMTNENVVDNLDKSYI